MAIAIALSLTPPAGILNDILTTCVEGGSSYWLQCNRVKRDKDLNVTKIVGCFDNTGEMPEGTKWGNADHMTIQRGIKRLLNGSVKVSSEIRLQVFGLVTDPDYSGWDAWTADAILQAGLLNDITFG